MCVEILSPRFVTFFITVSNIWDSTTRFQKPCSSQRVYQAGYQSCTYWIPNSNQWCCRWCGIRILEVCWWSYILLKTTRVLCRGIYRMTYMSCLNGHQVMVLISMPKSVKPWRLISVEPYHIMLTVLQIGSDKLEYVDKTKLLGLWLQNDLKWQTQVDVMLKKKKKKKEKKRKIWLRSGWAHSCLQELCQTGYWICWCGLTLTAHSQIGWWFRAYSKKGMYNHSWSSLHYLHRVSNSVT